MVGGRTSLGAADLKGSAMIKGRGGGGGGLGGSKGGGGGGGEATGANGGYGTMGEAGKVGEGEVAMGVAEEAVTAGCRQRANANLRIYPYAGLVDLWFSE